MLMNDEIKKEVTSSNEIQEKTSEEVVNSKKLVKVEQKEIITKPKSEIKELETTSKALKVNEEKVIEKIKKFLAKIVTMQEDEEKKKEQEEKENKYIMEYYDLPYRYNETIVKILAQTPKKLFVYWDISDNDRNKYIETFGEDFFDKTYPVLLLYNEDKKYIKEIPINDFANSWYIDIQDPKTKYIIQLGRKFKNFMDNVDYQKVQQNNIILRTDYLPFADSNMLEAPNDHVLLELLPRFITFRNVKTNQEFVKDLRSFKDVFGNNYKVKDFYNDQYKEELSDGIFDMANPSSTLSSSTFK